MMWITSFVLCAAMAFQDGDSASISGEMRALYDAHLQAGQSSETLAELRAFWLEYDLTHGEDSAYLLQKSIILDWIGDSEESMRIFALVPDAALDQPYQLFNRLQERIQQDIALTTPLIMRLALLDPSKLSAWLHDSYSQRFAPRLAAGLDLGAHQKMLGQLAAQDSPARAFVPGLLAWVDALVAGPSAAALRSILARPLGDDLGRADRYRLLLLERGLGQAELRAEVEASLLALVNALELEAQQPLVKAQLGRRARVHYYLARACHTFANEFCADSVERKIDWLLRAARWDPDAADQELASAWAYEPGQLGGPQEFHSACARELGRLGRREDALRLWMELSLIDLDSLARVRREVQQLDPSANFGELWNDFLEARLPIAKDFELSTPDGFKMRLSDWKGRWVLLDFWGTWCVPCIKELPELNRLTGDVKERADERAGVLSIACRDTPQAVSAFLLVHGYDFPVVMGNDAVTHSFEVNGYPTKILVTPSGRWMKLAYGRVDWNAAARAILLGS